MSARSANGPALAPQGLASRRKRIASRRKRIVAGWLAGWVGLMLAGGWLLFDVRRRTLDEPNQQAARGQWLAWKRAVERNDPSLGPVARRPPKSDEPPGVVLLRDHFPAVALGCAVFVSLTYILLAVAMTGLFATPRAEPSTSDRRHSP